VTSTSKVAKRNEIYFSEVLAKGGVRLRKIRRPLVCLRGLQETTPSRYYGWITKVLQDEGIVENIAMHNPVRVLS